MREVLDQRLPGILGGSPEVRSLALLAGGASKEAWSVEVDVGAGRLPLVLRRATGGAIYTDQLSIREEYDVVRAAFDAGVSVPRPHGYLEDVAGRDAFLMQWLAGESIGRRIVRLPELAKAREALPSQMAEQLARIHSIPLSRVRFLPGPERPYATPVALAALEGMLETLPDPHPAIELGLLWMRDHPPPPRQPVLLHADFRLGNLMVDEQGLVGVLDWELARRGEPAEDLGWLLVKAWRFGVDERRVAGLGDVKPFLEQYNELSGLEITTAELFYWELAGNVRWAIGSVRQAMRHLDGEERSIELAVLGRLAAEVEYEILQLLERAGP